MTGRELLRRQLGELTSEIRHVRQRLIDNLSLKQYTKWQKRTRKMQQQYGCKWLAHIELDGISSKTENINLLVRWKNLVEQDAILQRRYDFELIDCEAA